MHVPSRPIRRSVRTAALLTLLAVAAVAALFAASALLAAPSAEVPTPDGLASSSHPNPDRWYKNPYPVFHWQPAHGVSGYSWLLTRLHTSVPDGDAEVGGGLSFAAKTDYATGLYPASVAVGDFNRDGIRDLAIANNAGGADASISVLLGNGDGSFAAKTDYATGGYPIAVAVGDFDSDGVQDLVAANNSDSTVSVLLGDGDGGFAARTDIATGVSPSSVAVGDYDRDGRPDLVTANWWDNTVSILLGNGDGSFREKTDFATSVNPQSVAVADFDRDGEAGPRDGEPTVPTP
jgi:hypothetical protein